MNALGLIRTVLAAAEPGRAQGRVIVSDTSRYCWLLKAPYDMGGQSLNDFIIKLFAANGYGEPSTTRVTSNSTEIWVEISGSDGMRTAFNGAAATINNDVHVEKILYVPKRGHVQQRYARDYEQLKAVPGAVEFDGIAYLIIPKTPFSKALQLLVNNGEIPGVRRVSVEVVGTTDLALCCYLYPGQNPRITEKMRPELEAKLEAAKETLRTSAQAILEFCHGFSAHQAVRAYKLTD